MAKDLELVEVEVAGVEKEKKEEVWGPPMNGNINTWFILHLKIIKIYNIPVEAQHVEQQFQQMAKGQLEVEGKEKEVEEKEQSKILCKISAYLINP
jgi:hypothetical protein